MDANKVIFQGSLQLKPREIIYEHEGGMHRINLAELPKKIRDLNKDFSKFIVVIGNGFEPKKKIVLKPVQIRITKNSIILSYGTYETSGCSHAPPFIGDLISAFMKSDRIPRAVMHCGNTHAKKIMLELEEIIFRPGVD